MIVTIRIPRFASPGSRLGSSERAIDPARTDSTFHAALTDSAEDWVIQGTPRAVFTPRPDVSEAPPRLGILTRAWSWLHTKYTLTTIKRLRVAETVSLGEKRFVSIVCVEGREFLIGGGSSGVSLLAQLSPASEFAGAVPKGTQGNAE